MNRVFASDKSSSVSDKRVFRAVEGIYGELDEATTDIQALEVRIRALETSSKDHEAHIDHLMKKSYPELERSSEKKAESIKAPAAEDLVSRLQARVTELECSLNETKYLLEQRDSDMEKLYGDIDIAFENGFKKGQSHAIASCVNQDKERRWHGDKYMTQAEFLKLYGDLDVWNAIGNEYHDTIKPVGRR